MKSDLIFNHHKRLRSPWRLAVFIVLYLIVLQLMWGVLRLGLWAWADGDDAAVDAALKGNWGFVAQAIVLFAAAAVTGWGCGLVLEGLPWRALGWAFHAKWWRDLVLGSLVGAASLVVATLIGAAAGGFDFALTTAAWWPVVARTIVVSGAIFILAAAAEEVLFRGYPLQTMLRAWPAWVALIPSSILFAYVHLNNPHVVRGFTFINTALAGVWLAVAYLRTRSLWFPLGVHWAWNWTMGALLGLPVSGITQIAPAPLLHTSDRGPAWLTGGAYGIEGGAACTAAILASIIFIWYTGLVSATVELKRLTSEENFEPDSASTLIDQHPTQAEQGTQP